MKTTFSFRFSEGPTPWETLVVYCPPTAPLADILRNAATDAMTGGFPDQILILAPEPVAKRLSELKSSDPAIRRLANLHDAILIGVQPFDSRGAALPLLGLAGRQAGQPIDLASLFTFGITRLFHDRGGEIRSTEGFHFVNPSGKHSRTFLRLSNLLVRQAEISFIAAGLLRFVPPDHDAIMIDTPSLFAAVAALEQIRRVFGLPNLAVENFGSYASASVVADRSTTTTFLISASTSGGLARRLQGEGSKPVYRSDQFIHVLYLAPSPSEFPIVCDLTRTRNPQGLAPESGQYRSGACALCTSGSSAIRLVGDQFEVGAQSNVAVDIERTLVLAKSVGPIARDLVGAGALQVRTDQTAGSVFHVDVPALMAAPGFSGRLDYICARVFPAGAQAIIHLNDSGSDALAARISQREPALPVLSQGDLEDGAMLEGGGAIVVVAGALGSGRSLRAIGLTLRSLAPTAPLVFIVGFSKASTNVLDRMTKTLKYTNTALEHGVFVVQTLPLPDRGFPNPWRAELELLLSPQFRALETPAAAAFEARRILLSSPAARDQDLFWRTAENHPLVFTQGFVFWNDYDYDPTTASQGDLYFAVASLLQTLRTTDDAKNLRASAFRHPVISDENFARFSDPVLQTCLLRAAEPSELNYLDYPQQSLEMRRLLTRIVTAPTTLRGGPAMEILIALATGRLKLRPDDTRGLLEDAVRQSSITAPMSAMCAYIQELLAL